MGSKTFGGIDTNMTQEEVIKEISEWANSSHAHLCNREGFPMGYKAGIAQAKTIVLGILSKIDVKQIEQWKKTSRELQKP